MISLCIFDMGGVLVRDFNVAPKLLAFLGRSETHFSQISSTVQNVLREYGMGHISETELWKCYETETGSALPREAETESLIGKFFTPYIDEDTQTVIDGLKNRGMRVVCGTNVNDSHYGIHQKLHQYACFDTVYASHLIHRSKPDADFFDYILKAENKKPQEVFFTDDFAENCEAAQRLEITTHHYVNADSLRKKLQELRIL